jgi:hypothetical protein
MHVVRTTIDISIMHVLKWSVWTTTTPCNFAKTMSPINQQLAIFLKKDEWQQEEATCFKQEQRTHAHSQQQPITRDAPSS